MSVNLMSAIFEVEFFDLQDENGNTTKASTAKLVLLAMADHANDEGEGAYPSIERLCRKTALSEQTIRNTFDALRHNGIIFLEGKSKYGTNNHTINTKSFPRAKEKEVEYLTLYPLDPLTGNVTPLTGNIKTLPVIPESSLTIIETNKQFSKTSKQDLAGMSVEMAILAGVGVSQETQDKNKLEQSATSAFESAFGITRPWDWWNIKKDWRDLLEMVVSEFRTDSECFKRYVIWYDDKGKFSGGMNATQIKRDPALFFTAWDMFKRQDVKPIEIQPTEIPDWKKGINL